MVTAVPPDFLRDMAQNVVRHFPVLEYCRIVRSWICPVPFVPDEKPFYGYVEPYRNLFISSGFSSVLIMAPIIGQLTKELLCGNKIPYDFRSFDPLRFETRRA